MKQDESKSQKIEILSLDMFDTHKEEMDIVEQFQKYFNADLGWHYYLDLAWIIREISALPKGSLVLDAGAGSGLLQFILSDIGYNIISADFMDRKFSSKYVGRFRRRICYLNSQKQTFDNRYTRYLKSSYYGNDVGKLSRLLGFFKRNDPQKYLMGFMDKNIFAPRKYFSKLFFKGNEDENCGSIFLYKCDLKNMLLLPEGIVDGVVSVSALEHNDHGDFEKCMEEMLRVTKPSGRLFITVGAAQFDDWFHVPSKGWCYSEATIRKIFRLPEDVQSNFSRKDLLFEEMRKEGNQLHQRLAPVYLLSGDNGMPWGKWDPKYQTVGISKIKT